MANFKVHLSGAVLASGAATTALLAIDLASQAQAPALFGLGVVGGLLPDIDADNSMPVRLVFSLLGLLGAFAAIFYALGHYRFSIGELVVLGISAFAVLRFLVFELFLRLTEHRGVFHSLLAVVFFGCLTTSLSYNLAQSPPWLAWLHGLLLGGGYLVHLTLDELSGVDLLGGRLKRSFGTALKPFGRDLKATLLMGALLIGMSPTLPETAVLVQLVSEKRLLKPLQARLWPPEGRWFAQFWHHRLRISHRLE
ncbi:MAG TPA: metal-dependent hydrolase [Methylothermaceae bacterium]|nr:metal-dependent hydrolase [Methylothermaceae bacterium]